MTRVIVFLARLPSQKNEKPNSGMRGDNNCVELVKLYDSSENLSHEI